LLVRSTEWNPEEGGTVHQATVEDVLRHQLHLQQQAVVLGVAAVARILLYKINIIVGIFTLYEQTNEFNLFLIKIFSQI
jgi:hypothetical protein